MLTITRRVGQAVLIGHNLELMLTKIRYHEVDLCISGPVVNDERTMTLLLNQPSTIAPGISVTLFKTQRSKAVLTFNLPRETMVLRKELRLPHRQLKVSGGSRVT